MKHSPLNVVAWHGNFAPYKYDLARFNVIGSISFDHPDPSIFTVLTAPSDLPGTANIDFVDLPAALARRRGHVPAAVVPPQRHDRVHGASCYGAYDAKAEGFLPGGASLHNCMSAHGPDAESWKSATNARAQAAEDRQHHGVHVREPLRHAADALCGRNPPSCSTIISKATAMPEKPDLLFITGLFFVLVGLGFKVAAVPFHFWSPDVYEGSPTLITAFMSTVVKTAAFAALYRLVDIDIVLPEALVKALWGMTFLTLAVGNLVALRQSSFKRLMAWSSIANSGFLLLLLLAQHRQAESALFYYLFTYSISTLGLFVIFILVKRAANGDERMQAFRGLFRAKPWVAIVTMILMLSLAGIPPLAGFMAKYQVLMMAIDRGFLKTALFAVAMTLIGMYYYLLVVREAFTPMEDPARPVISLPNAALILACGALTLFFGFVPFYLL